MNLWRTLTLSVAAASAAASYATANSALADVVERDNNNAAAAAAAASTLNADDDGGIMAFLSNELQRSSAFVQQFFFDANGDDNGGVTPQTVQLIVLEEDSTDDNDEYMVTRLSQELSRDEQQLACETAVQIFHERDALSQERSQLSQRLRGPFKRAFKAMSLHYFDEASCDDLDDARLEAACNRFIDMETAVRAFMVRGRSDEQVCELVTATPAVNGELSCKLCKRFVQMVDNALTQQVSQLQVVREIIGDICDSMSADSMCHKFLNQYDDIVEWLRQGTSPDKVCAQITMCTAAQASSLAVEPVDVSSYAVADGSDHACGYCSHITYVVAKVNEMAPDRLNCVRKLVAWGCKLAPKDCQCDVLVKNYDRIVAWVKQDKSPLDICTELKLCTKAAPAIASLSAAFAELMPLVHVAEPHTAALSLQDERTCFYCDYVTTLLQIALQEKTDIINEVRGYADLICQMLGPDSACHPYVEQLDAVIDALAQGKRPREICATMKYCGAAKTSSYAAALVMDAAFSNTLVTTRVHDERTCMYCDYGALVLKIILEQDAAQVDEMRQAADLVCGFLGPDHICHQYVNKLDKLIDGLKHGKHPRAICVKLEYCAAKSSAQALTAHVEHALTVFEAEHRAVDLRDDKKCFYCDYVATLLQIVMQEDPAQVNELREYADMICGILGPDNICHKYIDTLDKVIDGLHAGKYPRDICVSLKYCSAASTSTMVSALTTETTTTDFAAFDQRLVQTVTTALESAIDDCFVCTQIASILAVAVEEDPAQIDQIRQIGDLVCGFLPSESKCRPVMNELDTVIAALKKGEKPQTICHDLKFCKTATASIANAQPQAVAAPRAPLAMNVSCSYCSGVVTVLEVALQQKPDEVHEAREAAGMVCGLLPSSDQCHADLKLFDMAVMQLKSGKQPHEICTSLKFCSSTAAALAVTVADLAVVDPSLAPSRCTVCKQNSLLLASLLNAGPSRLAAFNAQMDAVCRLIPDTKECELLLKHRETIVDALARNDDIDAICTRVGECGVLATETNDMPAISMSCLLCEYTAEMVKFAAKDQNQLRLAKVALETMCVVLPPSARCDVLSSKFDDLVTLAQSGKSPSVACRAIALCGGSASGAAVVADSTTRADYLLPVQFAPTGDVLAVE